MKGSNDRLRGLLHRLTVTDYSLFQPLIFDISQESDFKHLEKVVEENQSNIRVFDQLESQLGELLKIRNPKERFSESDLSQHWQAWQEKHDAYLYGRWVYYPWKDQLVHIVEPEEFIELRTSRNRYKITGEEQAFLRKKSIGVIGLSVGQSVAVTAAIERICGKIKLADFDRLELTNLNRIRSGIHSLGLTKAVMVAREIAEVDPFIEVELFEEGIQEDNIDRFLNEPGNETHLVVEECDSLDIKVLTRIKAREYGIPVVMDTSDRGLIDIERFDLERDRPIFHGLVDEAILRNLKDLSTGDKMPYILDMVNAEGFSKRFKASMLEVEQSLTTWPQLSSAVTMGGAIATDCARRILLGQLERSGRFYVDLDELIPDRKQQKNNTLPERPAALEWPEIENAFKEYGRHDAGAITPDEDQIRDLVEHAGHAPSGGNVQPWKWYYREGVLYLFHEKAKSFSFLDYLHRGTMIGMGAAAENLKQRAAYHGWAVQDEFRPGGHPDLLASFVFEELKEPQSKFHQLGDRLKQRLTNRLTGEGEQKLSLSIKGDLEELMAEEPGFHLNLVEDEARRNALSEIIAGVERIRLLDEWGHSDFIAEARWTQEEAEKTRDGVDLATLELSASDHAGMRLLRDGEAISYLRRWDKGGGFIEMARKAPRRSAALCLLYADEDSEAAVYHGGKIMERIWLYCNINGVAMQPVSPSTFIFYRIKRQDRHLEKHLMAQLEELHEHFRNLLNLPGQSNELFLFRLFEAAEPQVKSLRYPLKDILLINKDK
mgnify:FL=1